MIYDDIVFSFFSSLIITNVFFFNEENVENKIQDYDLNDNVKENVNNEINCV